MGKSNQNKLSLKYSSGDGFKLEWLLDEIEETVTHLYKGSKIQTLEVEIIIKEEDKSVCREQLEPLDNMWDDTSEY